MSKKKAISIDKSIKGFLSPAAQKVKRAAEYQMDLDFRYASATVAAVLESILHLGETVEIHTAPDKTEFDIVIRSNKLIAIIAELRNP